MKPANAATRHQEALDLDRLDRDGYAVVSSLLDHAEVRALVEAIEAVQNAERDADARRSGNLRNVFARVPPAKQLLRHPDIVELVASVLGPAAFAVRAIVFDKTPDRNWHVGWHQDTAIPLAQAVPADELPDGFGPQSVKDGVPHTRATGALLERMVTLRLHLDDCDEDNGPLRVIPGSHRHGRLADDEIREQYGSHNAVALPVSAGGAVVMRPLLLHASSPARHADATPRHRRVLHLEFAAEPLPAPLAWHRGVPAADAAAGTRSHGVAVASSRPLRS